MPFYCVDQFDYFQEEEILVAYYASQGSVPFPFLQKKIEKVHNFNGKIIQKLCFLQKCASSGKKVML